MHGYFHYAEKKGYSGVGLHCRRQPDQIIEGLGIADIDAEGRYLEAQFGKLSVISALPTFRLQPWNDRKPNLPSWHAFAHIWKNSLPLVGK